MKYIQKLLDIFKPDREEQDNNESLTNKKLLEELTIHFKTMLNTESVGQRMLYPMSFNILMEPSDYNDRKQSLPFVLPQVVSAFYGIIEDMRQEYPDYTPPAKYWYFQFSACHVGAVPTGGTQPLMVRKGHITTVASLLTFDIKDTNNMSANANTRVSIKLDDSNVMNNVNVNWTAIKNIDVISDGTFTYNFDSTLNRDAQNISKNSNIAEINGFAELSYSKGGRIYSFIMKDNLIHISGKNEMRNGRSFFILDSPEIKDSHVQIKYLAAESKFQIAAYGPTRLNSKKITESYGGDVYWYDLANHSSIFINDEISVRFEIK